MGGGVYTFKMPTAGVRVSVTFVPAAPTVPTVPDGEDACPSLAFADLRADAWYHEAVDYVLANGLMSGLGNGTFDPDGTLSRAMLAQIHYNREGRPASGGGSPFTDVADGAWYADAVIWASSRGIVGGYGNGLFGPMDRITREQLAVMLWRSAGCPASAHSLASFADAGQISGYALEAMRWVTENGIVTGYGDGTLKPKGSATRAVAAQMLKNFSEYLSRQ